MAENFNQTFRPIKDEQFINIINILGNFDIINGPWIAGGSIRKLWQDIEWQDGDIDIFFNCRNQFLNFTTSLARKLDRNIHYSESTFTSLDNAIEYFHSPKLKIANQLTIESTYITDNAQTYTLYGPLADDKAIKIQAICKNFYPSAQNVIFDFDWTICQFVSDGKYMWATPNAIRDIEKNKIVFSDTTTRNIKIPRLMKYIAYGFDPDNELMLKALDYLETGKGCEVDDDY
jgi:hypothetical protein